MRKTPLLEFDRLKVYRAERLALDGLSLRVFAGEHVAVLGPNGSGKTTLVKTIARELYPVCRGEEDGVRIFNRARWNVDELRRRIGLVSDEQLSEAALAATGREMVLSGFFSSIGLYPHQKVTPRMERAGRRALKFMEISGLAGRPLAEMSSGQQRRVLIARALVKGPRLLLLDEPTRGLDLSATHRVRGAVRKVARAGKTLLLVTHTLEDIVPEIGRVVLISGGKIAADGPKEKILTAGNLSELFGLKVSLSLRAGVYRAVAVRSRRG